MKTCWYTYMTSGLHDNIINNPNYEMTAVQESLILLCPLKKPWYYYISKALRLGVSVCENNAALPDVSLTIRLCRKGELTDEALERPLSIVCAQMSHQCTLVST